MGAIVGELADVAVVTSDNPRTEDPRAIIDDILAGVVGADAALHVEPDRRAAIAWALEHGRPGDVIVLAGKGHEWRSGLSRRSADKKQWKSSCGCDIIACLV